MRCSGSGRREPRLQLPDYPQERRQDDKVSQQDRRHRDQKHHPDLIQWQTEMLHQPCERILDKDLTQTKPQSVAANLA